jgi:hypothetical protein
MAAAAAAEPASRGGALGREGERPRVASMGDDTHSVFQEPE